MCSTEDILLSMYLNFMDNSNFSDFKFMDSNCNQMQFQVQEILYFLLSLFSRNSTISIWKLHQSPFVSYSNIQQLFHTGYMRKARQCKQWMWRLHKNKIKPRMTTGITAQLIACLEQELCHQCEQTGFPFHTWVPMGNQMTKDLNRKK